MALWNVWKFILIGVAVGVGFGAAAQDLTTGTFGYPCFDNDTCAVGAMCNGSGLCEPCGEFGEPACDGSYCIDGFRGVEPIGRGDLRYCMYNINDVTHRKNCGSPGFFMCEGSKKCWGAAVPLQGTRLCVACGLLGQFCCGDECRELLSEGVCVAGRCVPRTSQQPGSGQGQNNSGNSGAAPGSLFGNDGSELGQSFDDYMDRLEATEPTPPPADLSVLPPILRPHAGLGLTECACFSSDGRNATCANNGCVEPENFSGRCEWWCDDVNGNSRVFRGRDGAVLR